MKLEGYLMMLTEMVLLLIASCMVMAFAALQGQPHLKRAQAEDFDECGIESESSKPTVH